MLATDEDETVYGVARCCRDQTVVVASEGCWTVEFTRCDDCGENPQLAAFELDGEVTWLPDVSTA